MRRMSVWVAACVVAWMAPGVAMAQTVAQARQQQGGALAQHLGAGWRFDAGSCELRKEEAAGLNVTIVPMAQAGASFSGSGAEVVCRGGASCVVRKMDGRVVSQAAKMMLVSGATWESTHAANLLTRVSALCQIQATADAGTVQRASALESPQVRAFIQSRREVVFAALRPRLNDAMRMTASSCVIEEPRTGGAVASLPVRELAMQVPTASAQGLTARVICPVNKACITIRGGATPTATSASWQLKGTSAQQATVAPNFAELKRLCVYDHQLPPVIN